MGLHMRCTKIALNAPKCTKMVTVPLSFRLSPSRPHTVPLWSDVISFRFIQTRKNDLEVGGPVFHAAHFTSLAHITHPQIEPIFMTIFFVQSKITPLNFYQF